MPPPEDPPDNPPLPLQESPAPRREVSRACSVPEEKRLRLRSKPSRSKPPRETYHEGWLMGRPAKARLQRSLTPSALAQASHLCLESGGRRRSRSLVVRTRKC